MKSYYVRVTIRQWVFAQDEEDMQDQVCDAHDCGAEDIEILEINEKPEQEED